MHDPDTRSTRPVLALLSTLRARVAGVTGCVLAGVDGLVILDDRSEGQDPYNVAALAAAAAGVGRQVGIAMRHGHHLMDCTVHNSHGYLTIYGVDGSSLLAVIGDENLNVALLHLEARVVLPKIADLLAQLALGTHDRPARAVSGSAA